MSAFRGYGRWRPKRKFPRKKKAAAQAALSMAKSNRRKIREQTDLNYNFNAVAITGTLNATPALTELPLVQDQDGFKLTAKSIRVKGWIKRTLASALIDDYRFDVVLDRMPHKALPLPLELYGSATPTINVFKKSGAQERFKILRSVSGLFSPNINDAIQFDLYIKLNLIQKTDTIGDFGIDELLTNGLSCIYWTTAAANQPTFSFHWSYTKFDE